jgi:inosose dehydratase
MPEGYSRRKFIATMGAVAASSCLPAVAGARLPAIFGAERLYPPMDLSYFDRPISPAAAEIRFGYSAITWGGNDRQAIEDIAAVGFPAVQLRSNVLDEFKGDTAGTVRALLLQNKIKMVAFSSGNLDVEKPEAEQYDEHVAHAKFVRDVGGLYLQVTSARPKNRAVTSDDYAKFGHMLTELGKRTADEGISLGFHNHMGSLGQGPDEVDKIFDAVDPRYAKLELDIAHYYQAGGDSAKAIHDYRDRLLFLHLKDVIEIPPGVRGGNTYKWVELGRGLVDVPGVMAALQKDNFRGWAVVELDSVPDPDRTPKECAEINKKYVEEKLGYTI